jgi:hypothetical protein
MRLEAPTVDKEPIVYGVTRSGEIVGKNTWDKVLFALV